MHIKNLIVSGKHGIHPEEKQNAQRFQIDLELQFDFSKAQISDNLVDTFDWKEINEKVTNVVEKNSFNLVERLTDEIVTMLHKQYSFSHVKATILKLDVWGGNGVPGITIERSA